MVALLGCAMLLFAPSIFHPRSAVRPLKGVEYDFITTPDNTKQRLDVYLSTAFEQYSRSFMSGLCDKGKVTVNGKVEGKAYKMGNGDNVHVDIDIKEDKSVVNPEYIPLDILYEDEHIIAINKPNGMVVHPAPGSPNGTFVNALLYHLGDDAQKLLLAQKSMIALDDDDTNDDDVDLENDLPETPEAAQASPQYLRPGIVHRLDKGTSGVLLAAKHPEAVTKLCALFAQRNIRKIYLAVCIGHPGETTIVDPIGRCRKNRQLMTVYDGPPGKPALTHVRTLAFDGKISASLVRIETGRTHQIRVHLKERRTPIAGDEAYGTAEWNKKLARSDNIHRPLLHAYETEFTHPFTGKSITIRAPIPPDMANLLKKLTVAKDPLLDVATSLLIGSTDVRGKDAGEKGKGFVPSDRLVLEEDHWTTYDLPDTLDELNLI